MVNVPEKHELAWWLDARRRYFARQASREGFELDDDILTVFERFDVVWPLNVRTPSRCCQNGRLVDVWRAVSGWAWSWLLPEPSPWKSHLLRRRMLAAPTPLFSPFNPMLPLVALSAVAVSPQAFRM
jgi:hypothetical protein